MGFPHLRLLRGLRDPSEIPSEHPALGHLRLG